MRIVVNKISYPLEVKSSPESIKRGLAGKFSLKGGAVFIFPDEGSRTFWMKDCKIPLDIVFLSNNIVNGIHHNCQPCDTDICDRYNGNGNVVIEFNGGFCKSNNILKGDTLDIRLY